ncbi:hypothetical protein GCM10022393_04420 [Aquimarina addita]|uniref:Carboxypeptidase-like regulatory domain-containing protein n=1 Tax=Aquimarina addita TaxID=870485 RepID=A0ABP7X9K0_9FLAO
MIKSIVSLLLLCCFQIYGQSDRLKGKIIADSLEGFAINIVNFTQKTGTTNDDNGYFEIPAAIHDSIIFSSVQYEVISIIVSENDMNATDFTIRLTPVVRMLDEVEVSTTNLSGNVDKDTKTIEVLPYVSNQTLGLPFKDRKQPTQIERKIYTARSGVIDLPINYLNGTLKRLKRLKALEDLDLLIDKGTTTFNTAFFVDSIGVPEDLITDFMYYCAEDEYFKDLLKNSKKLSLLEFFKQKSKDYKLLKEID